jgi:hypothetical protein
MNNADSGSMPFKVKDCALITRMAGIGTAMNLRELLERVRVIPNECLFHHFCETVLRPTFDDPEFRNDFAVWAKRSLRDRVLAERLAIINPYKYRSFADLRHQLIDIIEERLSEVGQIQWVAPEQQFYFMQAVTVVFDTGVELREPSDLISQLRNMSHGSIYYHFVEARRRTPNGLDDFSAWLAVYEDGIEDLLQLLRSIDFYYLSLSELKQSLVEVVGQAGIERVDA